MTHVRTLAVALTLVMLTHGAAASSPFSSTALVVDGSATVEGRALALFARDAPPHGVTWTIEAEAVEIERRIYAWWEVTKPDGVAAYQNIQERPSELHSFTSVTLRSDGSQPQGAILVLGHDLAAAAISPGGLRAESARDPAFHQQSPEEAEGGEVPELEIHHTVAGEHVLLTTTRASFALEGDLTVVLFGPAYRLVGGEGEFEGLTGKRESSRVAAYAEGVFERHVLKLTKATLRMQAPGEAQLVSPSARATFEGAVLAEDPRGEFPLLLPSAGGHAWSGRGTLDLTPADGRVAVRPVEGDLRAAGQRTAVSGVPLVPVALGALALVAVAAVAVVVARRRGAEDDDPVALALLAMEDRRWSDALPHVERALARAPHDARLLVDRAICLEETGRLAQAREGYEAALRAEPFNAETHYYYARTLARLQNSTAALAHLGRALSLDARLRELARREAVFASFRDHPQFLRLLD